MITEIEHPSEGAGSLVSGIVDDLRDLVKIELRWARQELGGAVRKSREAVALWALGWFLGLLSGVSFVVMLAELIHSLASPIHSDPSSLPMWSCYAIVGVVLAIPAIMVMMMGRNKLNEVRLLDESQTSKTEVQDGR